MSPKNKDKASTQEFKIEKFNLYNKKNVNINDIEVPDHVFLGLIEGNIKGPLNVFPKIYAIVSFKKATKIMR